MVFFEAGDMILTSKPYVYVLYNKCRGTHCDFCFKKSLFLKRCGKCHFVNYCNKSCQVPAWETHKMECKFLKEILDWPEDTVRMTSLVILKLKKYGPDEPSETVYGRKVTFGSLMSHAEDIKQSETHSTAARVMKLCVQDFIGEENTPPLEEFFEIYGKIIVNQFSIKEAFRDIGAGLYLGASVIDHSCDPNAAEVFCGPDLWLRATKNFRIEDNDTSQVRISYLSEVELPDERQRILMSGYFFQCQCTRCSNEELVDEMTKVLAPDEIAIPYIAELRDTLERVKVMPEHEAFFSTDLNTLENLIQKDIIADTHIIKIKVLQQLYETYMGKLGNHGKALLYGLPLIQPYRLYYGPYCPTVGYHAFEISNISLEEGNFPQYLIYKALAIDILRVTMGEEHPMFQTFFKDVFKNLLRGHQ